MGPDSTLTYYSTDIFSPFESRHTSFFNLRTRILISLSEGKQGLAEVDLVMIQTSFLFLWKLCNLRSGSVFVSLCKYSILARKAKRKEGLVQTFFYETSAPTFLID